MRRPTLALASLLVALGAFAGAVRADFVTETWGNTERCRHRGTIRAEGDRLLVDLTALPAGATVYRAVFRPSVERDGYESPVDLRPILAAGSDGSVEAVGQRLRLRPPDYRSFDLTKAVRAWVAAGEALPSIRVRSAPGLLVDESTLEISFEGGGVDALPNVTDLEAISRGGQTFLTFREIEDTLGEDRVPFGELERKVLESEKRRRLTYRVYRHRDPITARTLGDADLVDEVRAVLSIYNLQMISTVEHANREAGNYPSSLIEGGNRVRSDRVTHLRVADESAPLPHGVGLSVVPQTESGPFYYAVTTCVDGCEAVGELDAGCSTPGPVAHRPGPIEPVLQLSRAARRRDEEGTIHEYALWLREPYSQYPRTVWAQDFVPARLTEAKVPLEITTPSYGGVVTTTERHFVEGSIQVGVPSFSDPMFQGMHECVGTLRSYDDGAVQNYQQRLVFALIEWAQRRYPVDPDRVSIWGQFAFWAVRHGEVFSVVMADPYGNYSEMIEAQKRAWQWGRGVLGDRNWQGVPQWVYMDHRRWISENPDVELPYVFTWAATGSHVGDMGFLSVPATFRSLADTRRAFSGTWGHSWGFGPPATLKLAHRIRRGQPVPAFRNCTIDDCPGDGRWGEDGDYNGRMNAYLLWEPETIIDREKEFAITLTLDAQAPDDACRVDLTARRCRLFRPEPGSRLRWTQTPLADGDVIRTGETRADALRLVTVEGLEITTEPSRVTIR